MQNKALRAAGWIFLAFALMHAVRVLLRVRVVIHDFVVPQTVSVAAIIAGILLAGWMFYSAK